MSNTERHEQPELTLPGRREFSFLLSCVRSFFESETPLPPALDLDWNTLIQLAERHAVIGLLFRALERRNDTPKAMLSYLKQRTLESARFDLTLSVELVRLEQLFTSHGIQMVSLKGPALGSVLYGNAALRSSSDLDLLIRPGDVLPAKKLLEDSGFFMQSFLPSKEAEACLVRRDSQITFSRPITSDSDLLFVDLHWRLLPGYFPKSFDEQELWLQLNRVPIGETSVSTLSPEHLLLFLCAHGTKHLWDRLGWICDVARLVQLDLGIDWSDVFAKAKKTNTSRMLSLGLLLATKMLGVRLPEVAHERAHSDKLALTLMRKIEKRLYDVVLTPATAVESAVFSRHAFEGRVQRLRFVVGVFLEPTEAEYQALKLPIRLHGIYYLFRPLRLTAKYVQRLFE